MKSSRFKWMSIAAALLLAWPAAPADAQEVNFVGYTNACFGLACVIPDVSVFQGAVLGASSGPGSLLFYNSAFDITTLPFPDGTYRAGFGTSPVSGAMNEGNLGALEVLGLSSTSSVFNSVFRLAIRFTVPTLTSQVFEAALVGNIRTGAGGVSVDFAENTTVFDFFTAEGTPGTATLLVRDTNLNPSRPLVPITGQIQSEVVPEPVTVILLGTGLLGLALAARRRSAVEVEVE